MHRWSAPVIALALVLGACSSDGDGAGSTNGPDATGYPATTVATPGDSPDARAIPEPFDGDDDAFYEVPDPLPEGEVGDLIRVQPIDAADGETAMRIMYLSEDRTGTRRAATGTIVHPDGDAPEGGWPVIADAHGTTGIVEQCAPSRIGLVPPDHGIESVRIMADYIGLGPADERHPYLSKTAEANAILDAIVAGEHLLGEELSSRWMVVGHSQGGHGALATAELAAERLPDRELVGVVASAPGAQFEEIHGDELQLRIITSMILMGSQTEWPELDPADFFAPDLLETVEEIITENCLDDIVPAMIPLAASPDLFTVDPLTDPRTREFMAANDPLPEPIDVPVLLIAAGGDIIVVPERVEALRDRLCAIGQQTEFEVFPEADHGNLPTVAGELIDSWIGDRFDGRPADDDCS